MLRRGAFGSVEDKPSAALYVKLGGRNGGFLRRLDWKDESFADVVERHFDGLVTLLSSFHLVETPYLSRPYPKFCRDGGAYDHLARVREWLLPGEEIEA